MSPQPPHPLMPNQSELPRMRLIQEFWGYLQILTMYVNVKVYKTEFQSQSDQFSRRNYLSSEFEVMINSPLLQEGKFLIEYQSVFHLFHLCLILAALCKRSGPISFAASKASRGKGMARNFFAVPARLRSKSDQVCPLQVCQVLKVHHVKRSVAGKQASRQVGKEA